MSDSPIIIRRGTITDTATIVEFNAAMALETEQLTLDRRTLDAGVRGALADEAKALYFLAEIDGRVVGQLMITHEWSDWRNGPLWWIQSVYVHKDHRRRGVFRALYAYTRDEAKRAGAVGVRLYVEENNHIGQSTYRSLGMSMTHYRVMEETWAREA
jgi:ribosomal protein S18 acetylase RimI-like enzyme